MADDQVDPPAEWAGTVHIDPATVVIVGEDMATAADIARWMRHSRMAEVAGQPRFTGSTQFHYTGDPTMDAGAARWWDVGICAVLCGTLVCIVFIARSG